MARLLEGVEHVEIRAEDVELERPIGEGAHSIVFSGKWAGRRVAVKQLKTCFKKLSPKGHEAICRELAILNTVRHPNIVQFLGVVPYQPIPIVMELCEGGSCFSLLHTSGVDLSWTQKLKMCTDVCQAMEYLHSFDAPVIHRDLKSLNVLVAKRVTCRSDAVTLKLADFGQSRLLAEEGSGIMSKAVGTCHWMAPEMHYSDTYNETVDVYSYGMFMFEVLCRRVPFEDLDDLQLLRRVVQQGERPSWENCPADCPQMLQTLTKLCWHQDPHSRPSFEKVNKYLGLVEQSVAALPQRCGAECADQVQAASHQLTVPQ